MAIRIAFCGEKCFDLIHYLSRIFYKIGKSTLLVDLSSQNDRSLEQSINIPQGIMHGHTVDNNGVRFSPHYYKKYEQEYKYILVYYGSTTEAIACDWKFIICNSNLESVHTAEKFLAYAKKQWKSNLGSENSYFRKEEPVVLYIDVTTDHKGYIRSKMNVSDRNFLSCEIEMKDIENRINVQYENTFKFNKLSLDYKDLVVKCASSICSEVPDKELQGAIREAERGK